VSRIRGSRGVSKEVYLSMEYLTFPEMTRCHASPDLNAALHITNTCRCLQRVHRGEITEDLH